ncbi:DUF2924 domain-containing protein, partial [Loktanella sp. DJP18]|uniref:DUF2924 domain-containing protein n=1 Tax=Loktanella sp. DJP18 TaxID=3409788 RepID=UPI003BB65AA9
MAGDGVANPDRAECLRMWSETFGSAPPPYLSVGFMTRALHHEAQCKRAGGLPAATRRALAQIAAGRAVRDVPTDPARPGTHYVREWNGRTYQVAVTPGGFVMDGRSWPSLSAIAKHITGTTWSGPRFFGLTRATG